MVANLPTKEVSMEFYSFSRRPARKGEIFDNRKQAVYRKEIDRKTGERRLVKDREVDVYDKIQEYAEETKLSNILARYNVNMLQKVKEGETQFVDLTNLPENLLETMTIIDNAKYLWERQSKDLKAKFDNDFKKFIAGSENGQIMKILTEELKVNQERFNTANQANYVAPTIKPEVPTTQVTPTVQPEVVAPTTTISNGGIASV